MVKPYKLIAFDIDGTILDENFRVCARLKQVVAQLTAQGYLFTLVSARLPLSVLAIANELGLINPEVIALNGSFITNENHEVLYSKTFSRNRVAKALNQLNKQVAINYYHEFDWKVENPLKYTEMELALIAPGYKLETFPLPAQLNKVTLMGETSLLLKAQQLLKQDDSLIASFSHVNYLELTCSTISKFNGLSYYARQKGINAKQIIAFGDGENDISMLSQVGLGVAMHNASLAVKKVAKAVAGNHAQQGAAKYLEMLINTNIL